MCELEKKFVSLTSENEDLKEQTRRGRTKEEELQKEVADIDNAYYQFKKDLSR